MPMTALTLWLFSKAIFLATSVYSFEISQPQLDKIGFSLAMTTATCQISTVKLTIIWKTMGDHLDNVGDKNWFWQKKYGTSTECK